MLIKGEMTGKCHHPSLEARRNPPANQVPPVHIFCYSLLLCVVSFMKYRVLIHRIYMYIIQ